MIVLSQPISKSSNPVFFNLESFPKSKCMLLTNQKPGKSDQILWGEGGVIPYIGIEPEKYTNQRRSKIIQFKTIKSIFKFYSIFIFKTYPPFIISGQWGRESVNQNTAALTKQQSDKIEKIQKTCLQIILGAAYED